MISGRLNPLILFCVLLVCLQWTPSARAQDYPSQPITIIVPLPPGGTLDPITRLIADRLSDRLGQPVVIANRPGASTMVGTTAAARSAPDGYTLLMGGTAALAVNASIFRKLPYDPRKDFDPVALILQVPFILVVNPSLPARSLADFVRLAKEKPDHFHYASSGRGTQPYLAMELLKTATGIRMVHVPYKGAMKGLIDVVGGHVQLMFADPGSALPQIRAGQVRALGVSSATRLTSAPDVPTIAELGFPGFEAVVWILVVAPAGTPPDIVQTLNAELKEIIALPEVRQKIVEFGVVPVDSPRPQDLPRFLEAEIVKWRGVVEKVGLAGSR